MILGVGNRVHIPLGEDAVGFLLGNWLVAGLLLVLVVFLNQQPVRLGFVGRPAAHAHQNPFAVQLLAVKHKLEVALGQALIRVAYRLPGSFIPQHHRAAAVLAFGDRAFEPSILHGVIFHLDGQPLIAGHVARALGHRPALEHSVQSKAEVVVQASGGVLLDDEWERSCFSGGGGLRRLARLSG